MRYSRASEAQSGFRSGSSGAIILNSASTTVVRFRWALAFAALVIFMPSANAAPVYPKGVWSSYGSSNEISAGVVNDLGVVGIGIPENWSEIETSDGVYDWTQLDDKIAQAKAAGFHHLGLHIIWSSADTPPWLVAELRAQGQTIILLDAHVSPTYCNPIETCLYWNPRYHSKRLALIAAAGEHYSADLDIVAVFASFANHDSQDWNIQDFVGDLPNCPDGQTTHVDQPQQWLDAGWTRAAMLQVGKEIADAVAAAFPTKCIKLPIGGLDVSLANTSPDPRGGDGNYSTLAYEITSYVYGDSTASPPIPAKDYADRFYIQRNTVADTWGEPVTDPPSYSAEGYIKYMIYQQAPQSGLQTVASASMCIPDGYTPCRLHGSQPCTSIAAVMQQAINVMVGYQTDFIELWTQDAANPLFYQMIANATIAMGGELRQPAQTIVPKPAQLLNLSTRLNVQTGENVSIGGFIITGNAAKTVMMRGIGPSLTGISPVLADPVLELHEPNGSLITSNDNWKDTQQIDIQDTTIAPVNDLESAIIATLSPASYTVVLRGNNGATGIGLAELYDLDPSADSTLANISIRGLVQTGDQVVIGGLILGNGTNSEKVIIRALGPSLSDIANPLADPTLYLYDKNGAMFMSDDNWQDDTGQADEIRAAGLPPENDLESAIVVTLPPDAYTAIVKGKNGDTGVALAEVYQLP